MLQISKVIRNAFLSGICGASGSLFGKLSGGFPGYENLWMLNVISFGLMICFNACVWTFFVKALQCSNSTLQVTLFSSATSYLASAVLGIIFFHETTKLLWWCGTVLILIGLILVSQEEHQPEKSNKLN